LFSFILVSAPFLWRSLQEAGGELVELLWQDGAVVAQAQAQTPHRRRSQSGAASGVTGEDAAAWLIPDGGGGGRDLYSQLWHGIADADAHGDASALVTGGGAGSSFCGSNAVTAPALLPFPEEEPASSSAGGRAVLLKRGRDELDNRGEFVFFSTL
jgi:phytochrome-interacting factor 4